MPRAGATIINVGQPGSKTNFLANGNFPFFQRGGISNTPAVGSGLNFVGPDRWRTYTNTGAFSGTVAQDSNVPNADSDFSLKLAMTPAAFGNVLHIDQFVEAETARKLAGKSASFGLYVNPRATTIQVQMFRANSRDNFGAETLFYNSGDITITDAIWQLMKFENIPIPSEGANGIRVLVLLKNQVQLALSNYFYSQIRFNEGVVLAPLTRFNGGTIKQELSECQRFFEKTYELFTHPGSSTTQGAQRSGGDFLASNNANSWFPWNYKVQKRITSPIVSAFSPNNGAGGSGGSMRADSASTAQNAFLDFAGAHSATIRVQESTMATQRYITYHATSDAEF